MRGTLTTAICMFLLSAGMASAQITTDSGPDPTRAGILQLIDEVGRFDIGGDVMTFGARTRDAPARVFLTVIQPDGTITASAKGANPHPPLYATPNAASMGTAMSTTIQLEEMIVSSSFAP